MIIKDEQVKHVWRTACDGECECGDVSVTPDYYESNGTPQCWCAIDMEYSHTDITMTPGDLIAELTIMFATSRIKEEHITSIGHQIGKNFWSGAAMTAIIEESKVKEIQRLGNKPMWAVFVTYKGDKGESKDVVNVVESEDFARGVYNSAIASADHVYCAGYGPVINGTEPQWLDGGE